MITGQRDGVLGLMGKLVRTATAAAAIFLVAFGVAFAFLGQDASFAVDYSLGAGCLEQHEADIPTVVLLGTDRVTKQPIAWRVLKLDNDYDCRTSDEESGVLAISVSLMGDLANTDGDARNAVAPAAWAEEAERVFSAAERRSLAATYTEGVTDGLYQEAPLHGSTVFLPSVFEIKDGRGFWSDGDRVACANGVPERWWTRSRVAGDELRAWAVNRGGRLFTSYEGISLGGRAAINVKKSDIAFSHFEAEPSGLCREMGQIKLLGEVGSARKSNVVVLALKSSDIPNVRCSDWRCADGLASVRVSVEGAPEGSFLMAAIVARSAQGELCLTSLDKVAELSAGSLSGEMHFCIPVAASPSEGRELWLFVENVTLGASEEVSPEPERCVLP